MKFGKQLQLGMYEPWKQYYIQYSKLKRIINRRRFIADQEAGKKRFKLSPSGLSLLKLPDGNTSINHDKGRRSSPESEMSPLNGGPPKTVYMGGREDYFEVPSSELGDADEGTDFFPAIAEDINKINNFFIGKLAELRYALEAILTERANAYRSHHTSSDASYLLRLRDIYVDLAALRSYCELNKMGFYKIIKKYDKLMEEKNVEEWMRTVEQQPFTNHSEAMMLMDSVTSLVSRDKLIEWERFATEQQNKTNDGVLPSVKFYGLFLSLLVFTLSLWSRSSFGNDVAASRCLSILLLAICLWITQAIPYFATALLIPVLVTVMGVLKDPLKPDRILSSEEAATFVTDHIFNHTTMLLLGGYTISTAFSRCQLELRVAAYLQAYMGSTPKLFILAIMFLGLFLSMWISNHTAPILCATIILPVVRDLPTNSRFSKALLLGLAYACNFGGMMTPISSLQNVLAVSCLEQAKLSVSFGQWILISVPFCTICTVVAWGLIVLIVKPDDINSIPIIVYDRGQVFGRKNFAMMGLSLLTLLLFAFFGYFKEIFGDIAIVALCFVFAMFGSGVLSEVDFNSLSWHTLFLVGGGNVLGKAVQSSGLLGYLSDFITVGLPLSKPWLSLAIILCFCLAIATFVSHTVASLILMPIISSIGSTLDMPVELVVGSAFAISAAMALPFSSFPNVNSLLIVDDFQQPYLDVEDFLKTGLIISIITTALIATLAFLLIHLIIPSGVW